MNAKDNNIAVWKEKSKYITNSKSPSPNKLKNDDDLKNYYEDAYNNMIEKPKKTNSSNKHLRSYSKSGLAKRSKAKNSASFNSTNKSSINMNSEISFSTSKQTSFVNNFGLKNTAYTTNEIKSEFEKEEDEGKVVLKKSKKNNVKSSKSLNSIRSKSKEREESSSSLKGKQKKNIENYIEENNKKFYDRNTKIKLYDQAMQKINEKRLLSTMSKINAESKELKHLNKMNTLRSISIEDKENSFYVDLLSDNLNRLDMKKIVPNTKAYDSNTEWQIGVQRKINTMQIMKDKATFKECTFSPVVNHIIPAFDKIHNLKPFKRQKTEEKYKALQEEKMKQFKHKRNFSSVTQVYRRQFTDVTNPFIQRRTSHIQFHDALIKDLDKIYKPNLKSSKKHICSEIKDRYRLKSCCLRYRQIKKRIDNEVLTNFTILSQKLNKYQSGINDLQLNKNYYEALSLLSKAEELLAESAALKEELNE